MAEVRAFLKDVSRVSWLGVLIVWARASWLAEWMAEVRAFLKDVSRASWLGVLIVWARASWLAAWLVKHERLPEVISIVIG
jgi:hypothetical protein